jgi:hypothetical protein
MKVLDPEIRHNGKFSKMAKQTIIIETAKELSLRCGMIVIMDN